MIVIGTQIEDAINTTRYDIWNKEVLEPKNYQTLTNGGETLQNPIKLSNTHKWGETLQTLTPSK